MAEPPMDATLVLLAGGESRRMRRPKSLLPVAGATLLEWMAGRLTPAFAELIVAGRPELVPPALQDRVVRDLHVGSGPLAGIEAGLAAASHPVVFALACDMPHVAPALARRLVAASAGHDAAVPRLGGRPQGVSAAYRASAAGPIAAAIAEGRLALREALRDLDVEYLDDLDPGLFANLNSPADFRRFIGAMHQKP